VRIRASTAKRQWRTDEQVELTVDLNNESGGRLAMARIPYCEVEIDGAWYVPALTERPVAGSYVVGPGIHARVGVIRLARNEWVLKSAVKGDIRTDARAFHRELLLASADPANQLRLAPGKHTCRVACEINGLAGDDAKRIGQPVSQPVEIEIASADSEPGRQPGESRPDTTHITPTRLNYFTTGHGIKVACSADGKLIAVANGNPTRILQVSGTSRVKGDWKPSADILDSETGKTVISLELTTADEDAVLAATDRISHVEVTAFAFSPAEDLIAVGTSVGQVKLFDARTGELVRSLDDEQPRLADPDTPEHWAPLQRGMGSVASIAFSPDGSLLAVCGSTFREFSDIFDGIQRLGRATTGPGRLKVWEVNTGKLKHDLAGHSHADAVSFSAGGELLASAGRWTSEADNGTGVIIWDAQTGAKMRTIPTGANGGTYAVVFSPTSKLMAIGSRHFDKENDTSTTTVSLADASSGITERPRALRTIDPDSGRSDGDREARNPGG
jgi:hypothetical protein